MASTYYVAASGGSDSNPGTSALPFATRAKGYSVMAGGDTLVFKNGTYTTLANIRLLQGSSNTKPPYGSAAAGYTVVMAETPGGVTFDYAGGGKPFEMQGPYASLGTPTYLKFDGFVFKRIQSYADLYGANHIKITRCGIESTTALGNDPTIQLNQCSLCLVEDCYIWGRGRYKLIFYDSDKLIARRCVGRSDDHDCSGDPLATFANYRSTNCEWQNCIAIDCDHPEFWRNVGEYGGGFLLPTTAGSGGPTALRGCLALKSAMGWGSVPANNGTVTVTDCVGWDLVGAMYFRNSCTVNHCTFGMIAGPPWYQRGQANEYDYAGVANNDGASVVVKNTAIYHVNGRATRNSTNSFNALWRGDAGTTPNWNAGTLGTGTTTAVDLAAAIDFICRVDHPSLIGDADDGGDVGANILKRIGTSGTLWGEAGYNTTTAENLWPWPYEDVIGPAMRAYSSTVAGIGTLSGNRGFAAVGQTLTNYVWNYLGNGNPYAAAGGAAVGTLAATLGAMTASATGTAPVAAALAKPLATLTASAAAVAPAAGALAKTLGVLTASAAGGVQAVAAGTLTKSLAPLTLAPATGKVAVAGAAAAVPLAALGLASAGVAPVTGAASATLGAVSLASAPPPMTPAPYAFLALRTAAGSLAVGVAANA